MATTTSEKITINMNAVDLGKVDLLVEEGFYANRSDFIRTAIRHQLTRHDTDLESSIIRREMLVGVLVHTRKGLEKYLAKNQRLRIRVVGVVVFEDDISPDLADATVDSIKVLGILRANKALKQRLADRIH